jgi:hypothetical protein
MKSYITLTIISFLILSCESPNQDNKISTDNSLIVEKDTISNSLADTKEFNPKEEEKTTNSFLKTFKDTTFNELHIWSKCAQNGCGKYTGTEIKQTEYKLLVGDSTATELIEQEWLLYACYKFKIDTNLIGLIVRMPSQYLESSIVLFVYNKLNRKFYKSVELADAFGDEGWHFTKESRITLNDNSIKVISQRTDTEPYDMDSSAEGLIEFESITEHDSTIIKIEIFK